MGRSTRRCEFANYSFRFVFYFLFFGFVWDFPSGVVSYCRLARDETEESLGIEAEARKSEGRARAAC